jgi:hypothetical protein
MDSICVDEKDQPFTIDPVSGFLAKNADAGGKGDFQGCSEFNPDMVFSKPEDDKFKQPKNKSERDQENKINRRVVIYLFRSGSEVTPGSWPCPRVKEGVAQCRKRFHSDGDFRRTPRGQERRTFDADGDTFACNFYDRISALSPCEQGPDSRDICCKQRGIVLNNVDPAQRGRLFVTVPALNAGQAMLAEPAVPYAGPGVGFFALPPIGANVWVDFEGGDINLPIWSGCFWSPGDVPVGAGLPGKLVFKTESVTLIFDDTPGAGGFSVSVETGGSVALNSSEIAVKNGTGASITETGPRVSINQGAVEVD